MYGVEIVKYPYASEVYVFQSDGQSWDRMVHNCGCATSGEHGALRKRGRMWSAEYGKMYA